MMSDKTINDLRIPPGSYPMKSGDLLHIREDGKAFLISPNGEVRREDDEPEPAPIDPQYKREFMEQMPRAEPLTINRIKGNVDRHLKVGGDDAA